MRRMRKHVYRLNFGHFVFGIHQRQVPCLRCRVTAHIYNAFGRRVKDHIYHIRMHSCAWGVGDNHIWTSMLLDEVIGKDVLHVTGIEQCIVDIVDFAIDLCIGNRLGNILDADHLAGTSGYEVGNGSRSRVQVVNELVTRQLGKVTGYTVEVISLIGIGLIETLGAYLELEVFHGFINEVLSLEQRQFQIVERIVAFLVVYIEYGCKLRELVCNMIEQ